MFRGCAPLPTISTKNTVFLSPLCIPVADQHLSSLAMCKGNRRNIEREQTIERGVRLGTGVGKRCRAMRTYMRIYIV